MELVRCSQRLGVERLGSDEDLVTTRLRHPLDEISCRLLRVALREERKLDPLRDHCLEELPTSGTC